MPTTCSPTVTYKRGPLTPSEHEQFIPLRQHWTPQCYFLTRQFIYYYHLEPQLWTDLVLKAESMMGEWEELQTQQQRSGLSETEQLACAKAVKEVHDKMEELLRGGGVLAGFYTAFIAAAARRGITQAEVDKAAESFGYQEAFTLDQVEDRVREERAKEHHIDEELRSPRADRIMDDFGPSNTSSPSSSQSSRSSRASATSQISNTIPVHSNGSELLTRSTALPPAYSSWPSSSLRARHNLASAHDRRPSTHSLSRPPTPPRLETRRNTQPLLGSSSQTSTIGGSIASLLTRLTNWAAAPPHQADQAG